MRQTNKLIVAALFAACSVNSSFGVQAVDLIKHRRHQQIAGGLSDQSLVQDKAAVQILMKDDGD